MNAAISHKYRSITFSDGVTSRKNYENLIVQIHNFIIGNNNCNLKFIMFHADDSSIQLSPCKKAQESENFFKNLLHFDTFGYQELS